MNNTALSCAETPMAWPTTVAPEDIKVCTTCALSISSLASGTLQILGRRQGNGVGDGVNIDESSTISAEFRGQRYTLEETIFHAPGLHRFPGKSDTAYPAELHVYLRTLSAPQRFLTIVIPVTHLESGLPGADWFSAAAAQPDPVRPKPRFTSLIDTTADLICFMGPDLRGRTKDSMRCSEDPSTERQYLLVTKPAGIRLSDLERIPREGSLSTDPRDMPAVGVAPQKRLSRDRLIQSAVLARPGFTVAKSLKSAPTTANTEMSCKPLRVQDGRDVVDVSGDTIDLAVLLGYKKRGGADSQDTLATTDMTGVKIGAFFLALLMILIGIFLADFFFQDWVWARFFVEMRQHTLIKWVVYTLIAIVSAVVLTLTIFL